MKRRALALPLLRYAGAQMWRVAQLLLTCIHRDPDAFFTRKMGQFLDRALIEFDQSSSNYRLNKACVSEQGNDLLSQVASKVAELYNAPFARIGTAGSSAAIRQVLGHVIPRARPFRSIILVDPACHKSVFGGLIESGLEVVLLRRSYTPSFGLYGPIDRGSFIETMDEFSDKISAIILTHPTYEGFDSDIGSIADICRTREVLLCIDNAWGSNYGLVDSFPPSPIKYADIVITSPHKKGLAPSQISVVMFQDSVLADLWDEASRIGCATTSPNWGLLALFEHRLALVNDGDWSRQWQHAAREARKFRSLVPHLHPGLRNVEAQDVDSLSGDPTHVYIDMTKAPCKARKLAETLSRDFQIDVEMAGPNGILFLFGPSHQGVSEALANKIASAISKTETSPPRVWHPPIYEDHVETQAFNPREAYFAEKTELSLRSAISEVSASQLFVYPPGIPLISYGQTITEAQIDAIEQLLAEGISIAGMPADTLINVTRAPPVKIQDLNTSPSKRAPKRMTTHHPDFEISGYAFGKTPTDVVTDVANLFREVFCNPPYNQFAAEKSAPVEARSFADLAPAGYVAQSEYLPLDVLDKTKLPPTAFRWMEPGEFEDRFIKKTNELYISTARTPDRRLAAFSVGRILTVQDLFYTEEVRNPIYYSGREFISTLRRSDDFYMRMQQHFDLSPNDKLFFALGYGAHPSIRGKPFLAPLMNALAANVLPEHTGLQALAEIPDDGAGRVFSQAVHQRVIYGLLGTSHAVVHASSLQSVMDHYEKGTRHLMSRVREQNRIQKKTFAPHPSDHPNTEIRKIDDKGNGVFATAAINPGELIADFVGETYFADLESELPEIMVDRCIQVGPKDYVFAENRLAEKINHSCKPNCGVREKTKITAIKAIRAGEEITWDYRMSENSDWVMEECQCGAARCSGRIEGYDSLPAEIRDEYLAKGAISSWLLDRF